MKKFFLTAMSLWTIGSIYAQVGVNTETPATTLHVLPGKTDGTTAEGIIAPNLKRSEVIAKDSKYATAQTGAMVYVSDLSGVLTTKTAKITTTGYYYFDGALWQPFTSGSASVTTADNGLTMNGTTTQLGGQITKNTTITGVYNLTLANNFTIVSGRLQITSGTPGAGKVLTSDASGYTTWGTLPAATVTTANNGLTMNGTTTQLGGALIQATSITGASTLTLATPLQISSGTPGAGKVLTSDASGNATWAANATPWYKVGTTVPSILNTDNSYLTAKTVIGGNTIASINGGTANAQLTVIGQDASINGITVGKGGNNGIDRPTNTAIGANSLEANTSGTNNTAIGSGALKSNQTASSNTAVGSQALQVNTTGGTNTAMGYSAGSSLTTGNGNTAIGYSAGANLTTGGYNVAIGYNVSLSDPAASFEMNIGNAIHGVTSLTAGAGRVSIGKTTPDAGVFLDVAGLTQITGAGKFKYVDSNQLPGRVLSTDNNGVAKWADQNMLTGSWFYLPSINLDMSTTTSKTINLFTAGVQQLIQTPIISSFGGGNLPTLPTAANAYEYMVVGSSGHITISNISSLGVMTYTPTTTNPPPFAYVNIIVRVK